MRKTNIITMIALTLFTVNAETIPKTELISSSGGSFANANYKLDWSIGEVVTESFSSTGLFLNQGFQQAKYNVESISTGVRNHESDYGIQVFPNPTTDLLLLSSTNENDIKDLKYSILDINGKTLLIGNLTKSTEQINFSYFPVGGYFIKFSTANKIIKTFKIIKN